MGSGSTKITRRRHIKGEEFWKFLSNKCLRTRVDRSRHARLMIAKKSSRLTSTFVHSRQHSATLVQSCQPSSTLVSSRPRSSTFFSAPFNTRHLSPTLSNSHSRLTSAFFVDLFLLTTEDDIMTKLL